MKEKVDQLNEKSRRMTQTKNACTAEHWQNQQGKNNTCLSANKVSRNDRMFIEVNMNQALGQWPQHFLSRMENTNIMGKCFKWCKLWFFNTRTSKHLSFHQWPVRQLSTRCPIHQFEKLQVACKKSHAICNKDLLTTHLSRHPLLQTLLFDEGKKRVAETSLYDTNEIAISTWQWAVGQTHEYASHKLHTHCSAWYTVSFDSVWHGICTAWILLMVPCSLPCVPKNQLSQSLSNLQTTSKYSTST